MPVTVRDRERIAEALEASYSRAMSIHLGEPGFSEPPLSDSAIAACIAIGGWIDSDRRNAAPRSHGTLRSVPSSAFNA